MPERTTDEADDPAGGSTADTSDESTESTDAQDGSERSELEIGDVRKRTRTAVGELLDHEFEGTIKLEASGDGWRTVVEVVERHAVPDTQDIIGRYEITLGPTGNVTGYELLERYHRDDMKKEL